LNPYSAISLLRSSSAFFLAFLFLHRKKPIKNAAAMTTMGMTTAIAILAPELKPLEEPDPDPDALKADAVELELDVSVVLSVAVPEAVVGLKVDVTVTRLGVGVVDSPGVVDGVWVKVCVTSTTLGLEVVVGATNVVEGGIEVTDVTVVGGVVSGVEVSEEPVTVTVVEKEVVKLVEVVIIVVSLTESELESVDMMTRDYRCAFLEQ
jgi:hypothetical protein